MFISQGFYNVKVTKLKSTKNRQKTILNQYSFSNFLCLTDIIISQFLPFESRGVLSTKSDVYNS